jgi:hypothetical protein
MKGRIEGSKMSEQLEGAEVPTAEEHGRGRDCLETLRGVGKAAQLRKEKLATEKEGSSGME